MAEWQVVALSVLASLLVAPAAAAKGPIQLCGIGGCTPLSTDGIYSAVRWQPGEFGISMRPSAPSSFYKLENGGFGGPIGYWVPAARRLRLLVEQAGPAKWVEPTAAEEAALGLAAAGLAAFPPPRSVTVAVNLERVRRPQTYFRLFSIGTPAVPGPAAGGWLPIFMWGGASPWNDGLDRLSIARRAGYLRINDVTLRISDRLAGQIRRRVPLTA